MLFYDCQTAPSPRRVRIFLAEKGIEVPSAQVDLRAGEQFEPAFKAINPRCAVPFLVLDDGTGIGETLAIQRYFEAIQPRPPLLGTDATEQAVIAMWDRFIEFDGLMAIAEALRNKAKPMAGRALPGPQGYDQIPALAERGRRRTEHFLAALDRRLGSTEFVAGPRFTVADITALVAVDFAAWIKCAPAADAASLRRWHEAVSARPSAAA